MLFYLLLFFSGLFGGFLSGMLGIGGGIVYIFILPIVLLQMGVPESEVVQYTVANSLFASFFAAFAANIQLYRSKHIFPREVLLVGLPAVALSILALKFVVNTPWYTRDQFNAVVILLLIYMIIKSITNARAVMPDRDRSLQHWPKMLATGAGAGVVAPLSGLGGGVLIIPLLNSWVKFDIKKATSISLGVIMMSSMTVTLINLFEIPTYVVAGLSQGYIVFELVLLLSVGVFFGSPLGVKAAHRLKSYQISFLFAGFISIVLFQKLYELIK